MRSNSKRCLATSGENAEVQRGLHKLTENPLSKERASFSVIRGSLFHFCQHIYGPHEYGDSGGTHRRLKKTAV